MIEVIVGVICLEVQDIYSFELFWVDGVVLLFFELGVYIDLYLFNGLVCQYFFCGFVEWLCYYCIVVFCCCDLCGGLVMLYVELWVGQWLCIGELCNFFLLLLEFGLCLLFVGGIGIMLLLVMVECLVCDGVDFQLYYCVYFVECVVFVDYFGWCVFVDCVYCYFDYGESSWCVDFCVLLVISLCDVQLYFCGLVGFMQWIEESVCELGWEVSCLYCEYFVVVL